MGPFTRTMRACRCARVHRRCACVHARLPSVCGCVRHRRMPRTHALRFASVTAVYCMGWRVRAWVGGCMGRHMCDAAHACLSYQSSVDEQLRAPSRRALPAAAAGGRGTTSSIGYTAGRRQRSRRHALAAPAARPTLPPGIATHV